jgi:hypothetical protein
MFIFVKSKHSAIPEDLVQSFLNIEESLSSHQKEMTKLKFFTEIAFEKYHLCLPDDDELINISNKNFNCKELLGCNNNNNNTVNRNDSSNNIFPYTNNKSNKIGNTKENKKEKYKDIDDLLKYINADEAENNKPKKAKKKNNKKDKKCLSSMRLNTISNTNNFIPIDREKMEKEIDDFKNYIKDNSIPAYSVRKIKPNLSSEWIVSIENIGRTIKSI